MTPTTEELAKELDRRASEAASISPMPRLWSADDQQLVRAAAARLRELSEAIRKAHRISIRHDHEITRLVDLQDFLAAQLTGTHSEP